MADRWREDTEFFGKFFQNHEENVRKAFSNSRVRRGQRWKVPPNPRSLGQIVRPGHDLLDHILSRFGIPYQTARVLDTYKRPNRIGGEYLSLLYKNISFLSGQAHNSKETAWPLREAKFGVSLILLALDSTAIILLKNRLALQIQRMFMHQGNRKVAFGLIITPSQYHVFLFDRAGPVSAPAPAFNYHEDSSRDDMFDGIHTRIRCYASVTEDEVLSTDYTVVKPGQTWFVPKGDEKKQFMIRDMWVSQQTLQGREDEGSILKHIHKSGILIGVPKCHHYEELSDSSGVDSIFQNRQLLSPPTDYSVRDRIHTQIVFTPTGKPLSQFSSRKELLLAFCDAAIAHRNIYEKAGILHRDITPENIMINADGEEGNRGFLIHFNRAIRIKGDSPYSDRTQLRPINSALARC
ncbi:hypothetical protein M422DRAFT_244768 [Sphaerobolus stellatus SS14]|nr:hypothetical protein M422DRAFT_244768 [Sphaerobolus stellatus SS14]